MSEKLLLGIGCLAMGGVLALLTVVFPDHLLRRQLLQAALLVGLLGVGASVLASLDWFVTAVGGKPASVADELQKLADLRDRGVLTEEEFQEQKRKLLETGPGGDTVTPGR